MIVDAPMLVMGRKGQLATDLVAVATDESIPILAIGRPEFDLTDPDAAERALDRYKPGAVINAAAYTAVDRAESDGAAAFALNRDGPEWLARACARAKIPFLHVSTDQVFDGARQGAYREDDITGPTCLYGQSKLAGEIAVLEANPSALVARTSWVFGPSGDNFVTKVLGWARAASQSGGQNEARPSLRIVSDQRGCPTYSPDLAFCLLTLAQIMAVGGTEAPTGILHLAGPDVMTRDEQARRIMAGAAARGGPFAEIIPILTRDFPTPATRPLNAQLDTGRLQALYGLQMQPFAATLSATLDRLLGPVKIG
jgi:dTDP-4-dehydrorhamnose reductase